MNHAGKTQHIGCYVAPEQRRQLVELARRDDLSVSSVIRRAIRREIAWANPIVGREDEHEG
jgi:post-segregation antitoxin (ccd killing protein)